jgi:hypothetical protein
MAVAVVVHPSTRKWRRLFGAFAGRNFKFEFFVMAAKPASVEQGVQPAMISCWPCGQICRSIIGIYPGIFNKPRATFKNTGCRFVQWRTCGLAQ